MYLLVRTENSDTFGVSRLGKKEHSESFPSLVTKLVTSIGLSFIFLSFLFRCSFLCKIDKLLLFDILFLCFVFFSP